MNEIVKQTKDIAEYLRIFYKIELNKKDILYIKACVSLAYMQGEIDQMTSIKDFRTYLPA